MRHTQIKYLAAAICVSFGLTGCESEAVKVAEPEIQPYARTVVDTTQKTNEEKSKDLFYLVNEYRKEKGLSWIPASVALNKVAAAHVKDLQEQFAVENAKQCNLHSWSIEGDWSPCCYTPDHSQKQCMWDKPNQISKGAYTGYGYEISVYHSKTMNAQRALDLWKTSESHYNLIINKGMWAEGWNAMGAAISDNYAVVWFGNDKDTSE